MREGNLRSLMPPLTIGQEIKNLVDFASNDYLGLARCPVQRMLVEKAYHRISKTADQPALGATGSRLLSGDSALARSLEQTLARVHNRPSSLLFNSGYDANLSVLSSLPCKENDFIIMDELVHNSLVMGVRMGRMRSENVHLFRHNNVDDLKRVISNLKSRTQQSFMLVVVESVYSMDGDIAPLRKMLDLCQETGAILMVDEAHGHGVYGKTNVQDMSLESDDGVDNDTCKKMLDKPEGGTGVLAALNLEHHPSLFCSIHTFGKAAGCHGAVVVGSNTLVSYLVNYARPFVYSTALPLHSLISIQQSYSSITGFEGEKRRCALFRTVKYFRREIVCALLALEISDRVTMLPSPSPIQALVIPGNQNCIEVCRYVREAGGLDVYPIRSPTVPKGEERIRIILHAHNTEDEIRKLIEVLLLALKKQFGSRSKL